MLTEARTWCHRGVDRFPEDHRFSECRIWEMGMPGITADVDSAWALFRNTVELTPEPLRAQEQHRALMVVGRVLARASLADSTEAVLLRARGGPDVDPYNELPYLEAGVRAVLGDFDGAVGLLAQYVAESEEGAQVEAAWETHWWWREMRGQPGFERLVRLSR